MDDARAGSARVGAVTFVCKHCGKSQPRLSDTRVPVANSYVTQAEAEVLSLRAQGMTSRQIGKRLSKHFKTVETLLLRARERFNAETNFELVAIYAASQKLRGRGRSSNRDFLAAERVTCGAPSSVDAPDSAIGPGTAPTRAL